MNAPTRLALALALAASPVLAGKTLFVTGDVKTDPGGGSGFAPWEAIAYDGSYSSALSIPGDRPVRALHRMDRLDSWLFAVEVKSDVGGLLPAGAAPRDVLRCAVDVCGIRAVDALHLVRRVLAPPNDRLRKHFFDVFAHLQVVNRCCLAPQLRAQSEDAFDQLDQFVRSMIDTISLYTAIMSVRTFPVLGVVTG